MLSFRDILLQDDIAPLVALVTGTGFFTPAEIAVAQELMEDAVFRGPASDYHFLLAEKSGQLVGYSCYGHISVTQSSYDLYWLVTEKLQQRQGIGRELLRATETAIRKQGGTRLYAETSSQPLYASTRGFYNASGFIAEAEIKHFYRQNDHRITFSKALT